MDRLKTEYRTRSTELETLRSRLTLDREELEKTSCQRNDLEMCLTGLKIEKVRMESEGKEIDKKITDLRKCVSVCFFNFCFIFITK